MSKPWGAVGAWAADAERAEAEERESAAAGKESLSFPSLKEAVAVKPKKKKATPMSLSEFTSGTPVGPGAAARRDFSMESKRLTNDEMLRLPTGPKERSAEEMDYGRLGGGFKNYGGRSSGPGGGGGRMGRGDEGGDGSWGGGGGGGGGGRRSYGGFDDERRSAPPPREMDLPSRADEVDNWATTKKPFAPMDSGRQDRYGSGDSGRQDRYSALGGGSRADEVDNWAVGKKPLPVRSTTSSFGSGFRDSVGPEPDRWTRSGPPPPRDGGDRDRDRDRDRGERTRLVLDPPRADVSVNDVAKTTRPSPFGAARPREEVLAEKGLDLKTSNPTSPHSSRPSSAHSNRSESSAPQVSEVVPKPRPKVNPFGDAKPREVLLQEQGKDWRKIEFELEHRSVDRPETMEEQLLKEEIDNMKKELEKVTGANGVLIHGSVGEQSGLQEMILSKEKDLELLICELDDKVRFGQKASSERPGSGAGRSTGFPERPPSQSGMPEEFRNVEYVDRPRSRGTGDVWTRPVDDRRSFQGGREGGFLSGREDRPRSRERW